MNVIEKIADNSNAESWSHQFRTKRFKLFLALLDTLPRPLKILDIGGTVAFWSAMEFDDQLVSITLLNLETQVVRDGQFTSIVGDATQIPFEDNSFDIVFSNSVIEHLFSRDNQLKMASEVQRVGKMYFIQTPNYWFPIEPHWVFPFFQFFPFTWKVWLTQHFQLGHMPLLRTKKAAINQVKEIQLLSKSELMALFPEATIVNEKLLGFNKSFIAHNFLK